MNLKTFFMGLSAQERQRFAELADTSVDYLVAHVLPRRKTPRPDFMDRLVAAVQHFRPDVTREQVIMYFYATGKEQVA